MSCKRIPKMESLTEVSAINRVNRQIRARQIRVIDEDGTQLGIMSVEDALHRAESKDLDLVEVAPKAVPPVVRIMDFGKYQYEQRKRAKKARANQKKIVIKELKFKSDTAEHDYQFKMRHAEEFLKSGAKVKATVTFRGREVVHSHLGLDMLQRLAKDLEEIAMIEQAPKMDTRTMSMLLAPKQTV